MSKQLQMFSEKHLYPEGFRYLPEFISREEEAFLLKIISGLSFSSFEMHGVEARRKIIHYGMKYDFLSRSADPMGEFPEWIRSLKKRVDLELQKDTGQVLVTHYPLGAPIGWHFDAPPFESLFGISLLSSSRFLLREGDNSRGEKREVLLEPRSAYIISGKSRTHWQHHMPPVKEERYSITFRTLRTS